jgi:hypothetical protein
VEIIGGLIVLAIGFYILKSAISLFSGPKVGDYFTCSSCGAKIRHSSRTISAWRGGLRSSICGNCHSNWLEAQRRSSGFNFGWLGCLAVIALIAIAVIALL